MKDRNRVERREPRTRVRISPRIHLPHSLPTLVRTRTNDARTRRGLDSSTPVLLPPLDALATEKTPSSFPQLVRSSSPPSSRTRPEMAGHQPDPQSIHNLTSLLPPASSNTLSIPSVDSLTHLIAQRLRNHLHSTYVGDSNLVVVNPLQVTSDQSEASKAEYEDRAYRLRQGKGGEDTLPHAYDLACRAYLTMRRTGETQSVVYR
jgi:hypothetical protein